MSYNPQNWGSCGWEYVEELKGQALILSRVGTEGGFVENLCSGPGSRRK